MVGTEPGPTSGTAATTCLVTGGAGFIGCAVSPHLLERFDRVVALDNLHPQVHASSTRPMALDAGVELVVGDVTSEETWDDLLETVRPSAVVHLAAETGTAQSLTEATRHSMVNVVGTTRMLDALVRHDALPDRILLTSSRAVYGEGEWADTHGVASYPGQRSATMLAAGEWDFAGLTALPFEASRTRAHPTSVYGATKLAQENLLTAWCRAVDVTPIVLRLQNVYGPGQSLSNPYTGIVSLFARLARAGEVIPVYEDGEIVRDFVYIDDVAAAIISALDAGASDRAFDVGSGQATSIMQLAELIARHYGAPSPVVNGMFRNGDVRAASSDIAATRDRLGWTPEVLVDEGVVRLCDWVDGQLSDG